MQLWRERILARSNMEYEGLAGYWGAMTDGYFGELVETALKLEPAVTQQYDDMIAQKRAEYAERYGSDWRFELIEAGYAALDEKACRDFEGELEDIYEKSLVLSEAVSTWGDYDWQLFASSHGCTVDEARAAVDALCAIGEKCGEAAVSAAFDVSLRFSLKGAELEESYTVYDLDGYFVSEELIDSTVTLINIAY